MAKVRDVISLIDQIAPPSFAMQGDRIGLQIGDPDQEVDKILVTLDITDPVIDEARVLGTQFILSHHALIYQALGNIRHDEIRGKYIKKLLLADMSVYVAHTNWDITDGGINDVLAETLELQEVSILDRLHNERLKKLVVFVPETHHSQVLEAITVAGGGWIGGYSHCTFNTPGYGTFKPHEGTQPFIGTTGKLERVQEIRLETVVTEEKITQVVDAMLQAHPYEEVAYDLYPLDIMGRPFGIGRIGTLKQEIPLEQFAHQVKHHLHARGIRYIGSPDHMIRKVAVLGGSGSDWIQQAVKKGADVLVTGDLKYHDAFDALEKGISVIDAGHNRTEFLAIQVMAKRLQTVCQDHGLDVQVEASKVDTEPFNFL